MNLSSLPTGTRGAIVDQIRRGVATVTEISGALDLTDNAVRFHLSSLERDGVIESAGRRKGFRKPIHVYKLTSEAENLYFRAFEPVLLELASVLSERSNPKEVAEIFALVGRRLASKVGIAGSAAFDERLAEVAALLVGLGAIATVETIGSSVQICGRKCPIASLVAVQPQACSIFKALLEAVLLRSVVEECDRSSIPACRFKIIASEA